MRRWIRIAGPALSLLVLLVMCSPAGPGQRAAVGPGLSPVARSGTGTAVPLPATVPRTPALPPALSVTVGQTAAAATAAVISPRQAQARRREARRAAVQEEAARPGSNAWWSDQLVARRWGASTTRGQSSAEANEQARTRLAIEGYAGVTSVNRGEAVPLHVSTGFSSYDLEIYRMGWYGGSGGRLMNRFAALSGGRQNDPFVDAATGMTAANWQVSFTVWTGVDWPSGVYLAKFITPDGGVSYAPFVVRDDSARADILYHVPLATYQAYNGWGGSGLYSFNSVGGQKAVSASFDRPYERWAGAGDFFSGDYSLIRWLEREGYDVTYVASDDLDARPDVFDQGRVFLAPWHDEYWSAPMRRRLSERVDNGMHLALLGANTMYWQARYAPAWDGRANRVLICYKDAADPIAKTSPALTTVEWRSPPVNLPENALLGVMYDSYFDFGVAFPWVAVNTWHWVYAGTGVQDGDLLPGVVGYEFDRLYDNGYTPPSLTLLSHSPVRDSYGRPAVQQSGIYDRPGGAIIFNVGTIYWPWFLDANQSHDRAADARVQRITHNVLDRMLE